MAPPNRTVSNSSTIATNDGDSSEVYESVLDVDDHIEMLSRASSTKKKPRRMASATGASSNTNNNNNISNADEMLKWPMKTKS
ncbi:expressed unknown protein [Seminavis robusta]|uniref:Uncharacterized protein n=1 Tax=Seminavis robusta TaxID=568900 RepID=A0A9N8ENX3_9STRA|nr:expressed unknown protein [Seminavis robusta]|eukprot:Sro1258_g256820.1 n/a (83) ;mRNA; r:16933-17181